VGISDTNEMFVVETFTYEHRICDCVSMSVIYSEEDGIHHNFTVLFSGTASN
jgi:hypothetical protein